MPKYKKIIIIIALGLFSVLLAYFAFQYTYDVAQRENYHQFESLAIEQADLVREELDIAFEASSMVQLLYHSTDTLDFSGFRLFTNSILYRNKVVNFIAWVPMITAADRENFLNQLKRQFPELSVNNARNLAGSAKKKRYFPIYFLNPIHDSTDLIGYDLSSNVTSFKLINHAIDSAQPIIGEQVFNNKPQNTGSLTQDEFLIYIPIFQKNKPLMTIFERRKHVSGLLITMFSLKNLQARMNTVHDKLNVSISTLPALYNKEQAVENLIYIKKFTLAKQDFYIKVSATQDFFSRWETMTPYIVFVACLAFFFFLGLFVFMVILSKSEIRMQVRRQTKELEFITQQMDLINGIQRRFIVGEESHKYFDYILQSLLALTNSEYGFIAEILYDNKQPYLKVLAITNIAWDYQTQQQVNDGDQITLEFRNMDNLFGEIVKTKEKVICNNVAIDQRSAGVPKGHMEIKTFLGIPIFSHGNFVGVAAVANHKSGYSEDLVYSITPFIVTCGHVIHAYKLERQRRELEEKNEQLATIDNLTKVNNRHFFDTSFDGYIQLTKTEAVVSALVFIDLDHFKEINDEYGHQAGDKMLVHIAQQLKGSIRRADLIARYGGDEFVIILYNINNLENLKEILNNMLTHVNSDALINDHVLTMGVSIGVAIFNQDKTNKTKIIEEADIAMYQAKKSGKNRYWIYKDE